MMNKSSVKKLLVAITLIAIVAIFTTNVQATGIVNPLNIQGTTTNTTVNTTTTNTTTNTTNTVKTNTTNTTTNTVSNYQNSNLPQTGDASDYAIFLIIAVGVVVAIFAYRKIKYYNM